jgi:formate dehydrogenase major subunit
MSTSEFNSPLITQRADLPDVAFSIDGAKERAKEGALLIDVLNRRETKIPQVCYHDQLGPIQTCDTCMVEVDGKLVRACATRVQAEMQVVTESARADAARREAFDRILGNHLLYCTVCDNNNGNCTVHNTTALDEGGTPVASLRCQALPEGRIESLLSIRS